MSISSKEQFKKYYKNIWDLLHAESSSMKEYNFIYNNKKYIINFAYSLSHSSLWINNYEIFIYFRGTDEDLINDMKYNNIQNFKQKNNLTYKELLLLFKKIKKYCI